MQHLRVIVMIGIGIGAGPFGCGSDAGSPGAVNTGGTSGTGGAIGGAGGGSGGAVGAAGGGGSAAQGGATAAGGGGGVTVAATGGTGGGDAATPADSGVDAPADAVALARFSFFVTSHEALRTLAKNDKGFGGDFRFGKADGLSGADEICRQIAETSMPGASQKNWRAFLSVVEGPNGQPVNAIDRVGEGPWYDRLGRLVAMNKTDLVQNRPTGADRAIINDLPNEKGIPNGYPNGGSMRVDNHHTLTGSTPRGLLNSTSKADTCQDWTSAVGTAGRPQCGVSWPRAAGDSWIGWGKEGGCAPGYNLIENTGPTEGGTAVGSNGGYGGIYCLALVP